MKDLLIYGALVAVVITVASGIITTMQTNLTTQGGTINTAVNTQAGNLATLATGG